MKYEWLDQYLLDKPGAEKDFKLPIWAAVPAAGWLPSSLWTAGASEEGGGSFSPEQPLRAPAARAAQSRSAKKFLPFTVSYLFSKFDMCGGGLPFFRAGRLLRRSSSLYLSHYTDYSAIRKREVDGGGPHVVPESRILCEGACAGRKTAP